MKKIISLLTVAIMFIAISTALPPVTATAEQNSDDSYVYEISDGEITITAYIGSDAIVTIPAEFDGLPVTSIGPSAFKLSEAVEKVTIPDGVLSIGSYAFYSCTALKSIKIPDSVEEIGDMAFSNCINLVQLTIPSSVMEIGEQAFFACDSLEKVTIPSGVEEIGSRAFSDCINLTSIYVSKDNPNYSSIGGVLMSKDRSSLYCYPAGKPETSYTIPKTVKQIEDYAFCANRNLENLTIPSSVIKIGAYVFAACDKITSINIPKNVGHINEGTFLDCFNLTSITTDKDSTYFASVNGVLFNKRKTYLISYPMGKTDKSYSIPVGVKNISNVAFYFAAFEKVSIPETITELKTNVFDMCPNLASVSVNKYNQEYRSVGGVVFDKDKTKLIYYPPNKASKIYTVPSSVTCINEYAFRYCINLKKVKIPAGTSEIYPLSFQGCSNLTSISVDANNRYYATVNGVLFSKDKTELMRYPEGITKNEYTVPTKVTDIYEYAFYGCHNLVKVNLPDNIKTIDDLAFFNCMSLEEIILRDEIYTDPSQIETYHFYYVDDDDYSNYYDYDDYIDGYVVIHNLYTGGICRPCTLSNHAFRAALPASLS